MYSDAPAYRELIAILAEIVVQGERRPANLPDPDERDAGQPLETVDTEMQLGCERRKTDGTGND